LEGSREVHEEENCGLTNRRKIAVGATPEGPFDDIGAARIGSTRGLDRTPMT